MKTKQKIARSWEIKYEEIQLERELGRGSFGKKCYFFGIFVEISLGVVYMGTWRKSPVAVKQLISAKYSEKELQDFQTEADLLM